MATNYKDTIMWAKRTEHLKQCIRGDMIHLIELSDSDRFNLFMKLARIDADRFSDAWINANETPEIQEAARLVIDRDIANVLEAHFHACYTLKFNAIRLAPSDPSANNNVFQPYGFQPYGVNMDSMLPPIEKILNKDTDWIDHSVYTTEDNSKGNKWSPPRT